MTDRSVVPILIGGAVAVVAFDALGTAASNQLGFSRALLVPGQLLIYGVVAALIARRGAWLLGLFSAFAIAIVDLTLGSVVSSAVGPGRPEGGFTVGAILGGVMTAFVAAGLAGGIGAWLGNAKFLRD
jgi:hypothetical protein